MLLSIHIDSRDGLFPIRETSTGTEDKRASDSLVLAVAVTKFTAGKQARISRPHLEPHRYLLDADISAIEGFPCRAAVKGNDAAHSNIFVILVEARRDVIVDGCIGPGAESS